MTWFNFRFADFSFSFLSILFEGIPFLLLGSLISGVIDAFVPARVIARFLPKNGGAAVVLSGLLGTVFPMCECGSVVVIRRFIRKGLPVSCAVTYMLAAPIVNPIVALSTFAAFRGQNPAVMTSLRLLLGFGIAVAVGFIAQQISAAKLLRADVVETLREEHHHHHAAETFAGKLLGAIRAAASDFLDVAFFLVIGSAISSVFNTALNQTLISPLATNPPLAIVSMMLLALGLALCSTSDAFIAASFVTFPFVAKLAFLVFGPMFDVKLFFLYSSVFRRKFVILLAVGLFVVIGVICGRLQVLNL